MKKLLFLFIVFITFTSCESVRVASDYEKQTVFSKYRTFAYLKNGIDKVEISDFDKKRILRAIEKNMIAKGFSKNENPDMLITFFTKEREQVQVWNNWGWGWGWNPWFWGGGNMVTTSVEGELFIDIIDAKTNELIWQGHGEGYLTDNREKKEERINEFVSKILAQYPPTLDAKK